MRSLKPSLIAIAVTMVVAVSANATMANGFSRNVPLALNTVATNSFSGKFPLTVSGSRGSNGTFCLTLVDNGSLGRPHSGQASIANVGNGGTFEVINNDIVVTIQSEGLAQAEGLVYVAHAANGTLGNGVYDGVLTGESVDTGLVTFGKKGGC